MFLCLSSYLIVRLLQQEFALEGAVSIKKYWMRRILRIWPLYFLGLTLAFAILPFGNCFLSYSSPAFRKAAEIQLIPYLLFIGNWSTAIFGYLPGYLGHLWTISLEEQFYVFLPAVFILSVKSRRRCSILLAAGFLGSVLLRAISIMINLPYPFIWTAAITRLEPFITGIFIALYWRFVDKEWISKWGFLIILCLFLSLMFSPHIVSNSLNSAWQFCVSAFIAGLMLILSITNRIIKKTLTFNFFRLGGRISYGLYIFHLFGINIVYSNLEVVSFWGWICNVILTFITIFVLSMISYYFFERPILRLKDRYSSIKSGAI